MASLGLRPIHLQPPPCRFARQIPPPHPPQCAHWGTFPPGGRLERSAGGETPLPPLLLVPIVPVTCKTVAQSHVSWPHQKNKIWMRRAGPKFLTGAHPRSAPYPCIHFPLSLFPSHTPSPSPRTLARNPHPAPVESTFAPKPARTLPFSAHSEPKQMAHAGAGFPSRRPVPGGRDGVWEQAGAPAQGHKKRALEHIQDPKNTM